MSEQEESVDVVDESPEAAAGDQNRDEAVDEPTSAGEPDEIIEPDSEVSDDDEVEVEEADEAGDIESEESEVDQAEDADDVDDVDDSQDIEESEVGQDSEDTAGEPGGEASPTDDAAGDLGDGDSDELDDLFLSIDDVDEDVIEVDVVGEGELDEVPDEESAPGLSAEQVREYQEERTRLQARIDELETTVESLEEEREQIRERMMRAAADLENFRKRSKREQQELRKYGIDKLSLELLPAVDNLERALAHAEASEEESNILDGVKMVYKQINSALEKHGVTGFEATGETFNPEHHEAIQQVESAEHDNGEVVEQFQKGYSIHDRLLRPALVSVAKRVEASDNEEQSTETEHDEQKDEEAPDAESVSEESSDAEE